MMEGTSVVEHSYNTSEASLDCGDSVPAGSHNSQEKVQNDNIPTTSGSSDDAPMPTSSNFAGNDLEKPPKDSPGPTPPPMGYEMREGFRILRELMSASNKNLNWPFIDAVDGTMYTDYYERIPKPMWLSKMKQRFMTLEYESITEFVSDFRLMIENCYRYNGADHQISKKAHRFETVLDQKIALLSRDLREKISMSATASKGAQSEESSYTVSYRRRGRAVATHDSSALLNQLREEELQREREYRRQQMLERKQQQEKYYEELNEWDVSLMAGDIHQQMKAMWELPQIGLFLYLCSDPLRVGEVPQYELERAMLLPRESMMMRLIMTSLLRTANQRIRDDKKPLFTYNQWSHKLHAKFEKWYKHLENSFSNIEKTSLVLGVEPRFFEILGRSNPLTHKRFHELSLYQRVWIVKSLCDNALETQEGLREAIEANPSTDQKEYYLGTDDEGYIYLHFPQFCGQDLRIYKQAPIKYPKMNKPEPTKATVKTPRHRKDASPAKKQKTETPRIRPSRLRQLIKPVLKASTPDASEDEKDDDDLTSVATAEDDEDEVASRTDVESKADDIEMKADDAESKADDDSISITSMSSKSSVASRQSRYRRYGARPRSRRRKARSRQTLKKKVNEATEGMDVDDDSSLAENMSQTGFGQTNMGCSTPTSVDLPFSAPSTPTQKSSPSQTIFNTCDMNQDCESMHSSVSERPFKNYEQTCNDAEKSACDGYKDCETNDTMKENHFDGLENQKNVENAVKIECSDGNSKPDMTEGLKDSESCHEDLKIEPSDVKNNDFKDIGSCKNGDNFVNDENYSRENPTADVKSDYDAKIKSEISEYKDLKCEIKMAADESALTDKTGDELAIEEAANDVEKKDLVKVEPSNAEQQTTDALTVSRDETNQNPIELLPEITPDLHGFELLAVSVDNLRDMIKYFVEPEPDIVGRGKNQRFVKAPRKRCVEDLYQRLVYLLKELEPWEQKLIAANRRMKQKLKKENDDWKEEPQQDVIEISSSDDSDAVSSDSSDSSSSDNEESDYYSIRPKTRSHKKRKKEADSECEIIKDVSSRGRLRKRRRIEGSESEESNKSMASVDKKAPPPRQPQPAKKPSAAKNVLSDQLLEQLKLPPNNVLIQTAQGLSIVSHTLLKHPSLIAMKPQILKVGPLTSANAAAAVKASGGVPVSETKTKTSVTATTCSSSARVLQVAPAAPTELQKPPVAKQQMQPVKSVLVQQKTSSVTVVSPITEAKSPRTTKPFVARLHKDDESGNVDYKFTKVSRPRLESIQSSSSTATTSQPTIAIALQSLSSPSKMCALQSSPSSIISTSSKPAIVYNHSGSSIPAQVLQALQSPQVRNQIASHHGGQIIIRATLPSAPLVKSSVITTTAPFRSKTTGLTVKSILESRQINSQAVLRSIGPQPSANSSQLEQQVKSIVSSVKTSLPTATMKIPAPTTLPIIQPRQVTQVNQAMKGPIPACGSFERQSNQQAMATNIATLPSSSLSMSAPGGSVAKLNLTAADTLQAGNLAKILQQSGQQNVVIRLVQQNAGGTQSIVQGYLTPKGLMIPQSQAAATLAHEGVGGVNTLSHGSQQNSIVVSSNSASTNIIQSNVSNLLQTGSSVYQTMPSSAAGIVTNVGSLTSNSDANSQSLASQLSPSQIAINHIAEALASQTGQMPLSKILSSNNAGEELVPPAADVVDAAGVHVHPNSSYIQSSQINRTTLPVNQLQAGQTASNQAFYGQNSVGQSNLNALNSSVPQNLKSRSLHSTNSIIGHMGQINLANLSAGGGTQNLQSLASMLQQQLSQQTSPQQQAEILKQILQNPQNQALLQVLQQQQQTPQNSVNTGLNIPSGTDNTAQNLMVQSQPQLQTTLLPGATSPGQQKNVFQVPVGATVVQQQLGLQVPAGSAQQVIQASAIKTGSSSTNPILLQAPGGHKILVTPQQLVSLQQQGQRIVLASGQLPILMPSSPKKPAITTQASLTPLLQPASSQQQVLNAASPQQMPSLKQFQTPTMPASSPKIGEPQVVFTTSPTAVTSVVQSSAQPSPQRRTVEKVTVQRLLEQRQQQLQAAAAAAKASVKPNVAVAVSQLVSDQTKNLIQSKSPVLAKSPNKSPLVAPKRSSQANVVIPPNQTVSQLLSQQLLSQVASCQAQLQASSTATISQSSGLTSSQKSTATQLIQSQLQQLSTTQQQQILQQIKALQQQSHIQQQQQPVVETIPTATIQHHPQPKHQPSQKAPQLSAQQQGLLLQALQAKYQLNSLNSSQVTQQSPSLPQNKSIPSSPQQTSSLSQRQLQTQQAALALQQLANQQVPTSSISNQVVQSNIYREQAIQDAHSILQQFAQKEQTSNVVGVQKGSLNDGAFIQQTATKAAIISPSVQSQSIVNSGGDATELARQQEILQIKQQLMQQSEELQMQKQLLQQQRLQQQQQQQPVQPPPAPKSPVGAASGSTGQKLVLYNINGQLVTAQGVPVCISQGAIKFMTPTQSSGAAALPHSLALTSATASPSVSNDMFTLAQQQLVARSAASLAADSANVAALTSMVQTSLAAGDATNPSAVNKLN